MAAGVCLDPELVLFIFKPLGDKFGINVSSKFYVPAAPDCDRLYPTRN